MMLDEFFNYEVKVEFIIMFLVINKFVGLV